MKKNGKYVDSIFDEHESVRSVYTPTRIINNGKKILKNAYLLDSKMDSNSEVEKYT